MAPEVHSATLFTVVRHGETVWNTLGLQQGHLNSELTPLGIAQAKALAAMLAERRFDLLYSSDLGRALQTARILSAALGLEVHPDPRLRERQMGVMQGLTLAEFGERYPLEMAAFRSGDPDHVIPGGESLRACTEKCIACMEEIAREYPRAQVLIVTHSGVLYGLFKHAVGLPLTGGRTFSLFNAAVNEFSVSESGAWMLLRWGCTGQGWTIPIADHW